MGRKIVLNVIISCKIIKSELTQKYFAFKILLIHIFTHSIYLLPQQLAILPMKQRLCSYRVQFLNLSKWNDKLYQGKTFDLGQLHSQAFSQSWRRQEPTAGPWEDWEQEVSVNQRTGSQGFASARFLSCILDQVNKREWHPKLKQLTNFCLFSDSFLNDFS